MTAEQGSRGGSIENAIDMDPQESTPREQGSGSRTISRGAPATPRSPAGSSPAPGAASEDARGLRPLGEGASAPNTEGMTSGAAASAGPDGANPRAGSGRDRPQTVRPIGPRSAQFMVASRQVSGLQPLSVNVIAQSLRDAPGVEIVKTINPPAALGLLSTESAATASVVVARMSHDKARLLQSQAGAGLLVEHDAPVTFGLDPGPTEFALPNPGVIVPLSEGFETVIEVSGPQGPLANAEVYVFGSMLPAQGVTDASGRTRISIVGESPETIRALYVKPKADFWDIWLPRPALAPGTVNAVVAKPLGALLKDFPDRQLLGWGQRAMGLDQIPTSYDGAGVKIAIIDSGAAQPTHRNLHHLGPGVSVVGDDRSAWTNDTIGHGSHCAGIIAGSPVGAGSGVRGFAPAAEIHVLRIFPGARFSDLVAALDYCMENGIDIASMSLGGGEPSRIVEERLVKAKEMGVACIIAAGNSGGPVQFPASTRHALAVSAIGKWGEFPGDSFHANQALPGFERQDGYFPAKFSCFGPEIDVCAPGVAIVSSLPPDDFAAWDGTSMAAPHVSGLAALVLAHHPDFKGSFQARDARRVERLFQIIKESATPLPIGDTTRLGVGLPNVPRALGLQAGTGTQPAFDGASAGDPAMQMLKRLLEMLAGHNGPAPAAGAPAPGHSPLSGEPFRNPEVERGPARTGGDAHGIAPAATEFGTGLGMANAAPPGVGEARTLLRRAGLL